MRQHFRHTHRPGFLLGFIDFFTAGLFFLVYMNMGFQDELEEILGHKVQPYWMAYLLGIPTLFIYTLVWMARIAEELKEKATQLGIDGPHTSWRHMFWWNLLGCLCFGPMIATHRFFKTLNRIERKLNQDQDKLPATPIESTTPPFDLTVTFRFVFCCENNVFYRALDSRID